jgi:hypothetical protein
MPRRYAIPFKTAKKSFVLMVERIENFTVIQNQVLNM